MKNLSLYLMLILSFSSAFSMEVGENESIETNPQSERISEAAARFNEPKSLLKLTSSFIAKTLVDKIKNDEDYKLFLASYALNKDVEDHILKSLFKNNPVLLWNVLPIDITQQDLHVSVQDLIVLDNNKFFVLFKEKSGENEISKIKIWDFKLNGWTDEDFVLPEILIISWLISKDLKTLFLHCDDGSILIYDLENKNVLSKIISNSSDIKFLCLAINDKFVCCSLANGSVEIFDKTGKQVCLFTPNDNHEIKLIDAIDNFIVTVDKEYMQTWKLYRNEFAEFQVKEVAKYFNNDYKAFGVKLCCAGEKIFVGFAYSDRQKLKLFTSCELKVLQENAIQPNLAIHDPMKTSLNNQILFLLESNRRRSKLASNFANRAYQRKKRIGFYSLKLIDSKSENVAKLHLDTMKQLEGIAWRGFVIAPDIDYIILYDDKGHIANISLNFDQDLKAVLEKIKVKI